MNQKDKKILLDFLKTQKLMSLATYGDKIWSAHAYYLFDDDLNIYFLSPTDAIHCKNIEKNPEVSLSIADSSIKASDNKIGFQMRGNAKKVKGALMMKKIISMWNKNHKDVPPITYNNMIRAMRSRFYKITPSYIKLFKEISGKEEQKTWEL